MSGQPVGYDFSLESTVEEIEGDEWGDPPPGATSLIATAHALRRKPVGELEPADIRLLVSQDIARAVLVPLALTMLEADPLVEGDYYRGDLLVAVLKTPVDFWMARPAQLARLRAVLDAVEANNDPIDGPADNVLAAIKAFREHVPS